MATSTTFNLLAVRDFEQALHKGNWREWFRWLMRKSNDLIPFNEIYRTLPVKGTHYLGYQSVPLKQIVGSEGRHRDFDRNFFPRQTHTRGRWINIDKAYYKGISLPPVELIKVGEVYFVRDGNHRISVARSQKKFFIDAYVTEIDTPVSLTIADLERT